MTVDERFDRTDASLQHLSESLQQLGESLQRLTDCVLDFRAETASRFEVVEHRLDMLSATAANIDARFAPLTKAMLDSGSLASQLVREQSRGKEVAADLAARLAKLEQQVLKLMDPAA